MGTSISMGKDFSGVGGMERAAVVAKARVKGGAWF